MRKEEVQKLIWEHFQKFMEGQTVSIYDDGEIDYYEYDVERFLRWRTR